MKGTFSESMFSLENKVALVTGSSKGIGAGIAVELARAGADVCINYAHSNGQANEVVAQIQALGRRAVAVQADVSDRHQVEALMETCESQLGPIDILVTNAVSSVRTSILETRFEDLQRTVELGIFGVFHAMQVVARKMVERQTKGSIIHVSSPHARTPFKEAIDYNVAKAGSLQLALSVANELMWHQIRVNVLEPGWTDTPGERTWYTDDKMQEMGERMPLRRMGVPADLGRAAVFLASDAASYIAGTVLRVDGGQFIEGGSSWESTGRHQ
ncbi:SDR family oxidoreductase [Alicyclobacillus tolerans]|uniref:SDR family NAD(P)-dependent oxidoreductase n=1 Tax=Alicyclobacillus tolerans TaxID=90970 RepID=UPI001F441041|nr:SDR family oxidoreductase [Alicyclobacillus tolerans]MCF8567328.1 SDR family oxidoreductase [Alicyclobacillus tolerans]